MNHSADSIEEVKSHENLPCNFFDKVKRKAFVVIPLENFEKVDSQDLKDHTKVVAVRPLVKERVQQVEYVAVVAIVFLFVRFVLLKRFNPLGMISITGHFLQDLNLSWL
jgi:ascorbate-specific PTS system EIIC-type component UlaA